MSVTPPSPLRSGDPITAIAPWTQKIVAYLRAITVRPSATVNVSVTPNGTLLSAAPSQTSRASSAAASPWAFEATATPETDNQGTPTGTYAVKVLGGTAQAIGGPTAIFPTLEVTDIADGEYFYIRFTLWNDNFEPTCYWYNDPTGAACTIEHAKTRPVSSNNARFITLVLAKVDSTAPGAIIQYRAGAIDIDATLSAGVAGSGITVRSISYPATPLEPEAPPSSGTT